jgi:hypothetical protein
VIWFKNLSGQIIQNYGSQNLGQGDGFLILSQRKIIPLTADKLGLLPLCYGEGSKHGEKGERKYLKG